MIRKYLFLIIIIFLFQESYSQEIKDDINKHIINFQKTVRKKYTENLSDILFSLIKIADSTNSDNIYAYRCTYAFEIPSSIVIVKNDSVDIYDIFAINEILSGIMNIQELSNENKLLWIDEILKEHLAATQESGTSAWILVQNHDKFTYHMPINHIE